VAVRPAPRKHGLFFFTAYTEGPPPLVVSLGETKGWRHHGNALRGEVVARLGKHLPRGFARVLVTAISVVALGGLNPGRRMSSAAGRTREHWVDCMCPVAPGRTDNRIRSPR